MLKKINKSKYVEHMGTDEERGREKGREGSH